MLYFAVICLICTGVISSYIPSGPENVTLSILWLPQLWHLHLIYTEVTMTMTVWHPKYTVINTAMSVTPHPHCGYPSHDSVTPHLQCGNLSHPWQCYTPSTLWWPPAIHDCVTPHLHCGYPNHDSVTPHLHCGYYNHECYTSSTLCLPQPTMNVTPHLPCGYYSHQRHYNNTVVTTNTTTWLARHILLRIITDITLPKTYYVRNGRDDDIIIHWARRCIYNVTT